ncbi:MAG: autotransporter domain-containing protein [Alphaproteobacteria bacterium]|nr:autotransporter domain-containing protein [Alphaproteobacteria bacterium]
MGRFCVVRLSSCAFVVVLGLAGQAAADDCFDIHHPTTISTDKRCVRVTDPVNGNVVNNATVGRSDRDRPGFFIGYGGLLTGQLINNGTIRGGGDEWGALTLGRNADVEGGIINNGTIVSTRGNAVQLGYRENWWEQPRGAALTGDIVNSGLIDGRDNGIAALYGTMSGALINEADGTITGGDVAVLIANSFTSWTGGIENHGLIAGDEAGIQIGSLSSYGVVFAGGIVNAAGAEITSEDGPSVAIGGESFSGGFFNGGLITQTGSGWLYEGVGVVFASRTVSGGLTNDIGGLVEGTLGPAVWVTSRTTVFNGGIVNRGTLDGASDGVLLQAGSFLDGVVNEATGRILGGSGAALRVAGGSFAGGVNNAGLIDGSTDGVLIEADSLLGGVVNTAAGRLFGGTGAGLNIAGLSFAGGVQNAGLIEGSIGVVFAANEVDGGLLNDVGGSIVGRTGAAVQVSGGAFAAGIVNRGSIEGASDGVVIGAGSFAGGIANASGAAIVGNGGAAVRVTPGTATFAGGLTNDGHIEGSQNGVAIESGSFAGDVVNHGGIEGGGIAFFMNTSLFDGALTNSGDIVGGATGVSLVLGQATGGFTNSGSISGDTGTGVFIDVGTWGSAETPADILNASGGSIFGGETGFWLKALSVFGDFVNNGSIKGGAANTGVHVEAATYVGDIVNNELIEAPSNALLLEIGALTGEVRNTGTIKATAPNGVAVALAIGNGTTFTNDGGGLIFGDAILGGPAAYTFVAGDGGLEGDLRGSGNDDVLVVEGTHYFVDGVLENLASFDVEDSGIAVMGGRSVGDPNGPGYASNNVDALTVRAGGQLYLDNNTILNVGSFTQEAGGELTYYLAAPSGTPVAGSDYGRIDASGPVSLNGTLSVILDAASFGGTTQNTFAYADIIRGSSFTGEFEDFQIRGSTYFFEMELTYGASSINLGVTRTPFDVILCEHFQTQNAEDLGASLEAAFLAGGFTPEQIQLFNFLGQLNDICGAYYDLGGAVLGDINAITVETAGPWKSAVNDRLNSTGATSCVVAGPGACLTRFAQNDAGGSQVMTDAEDPFAWLRTGVRPEGQFSVWGRLIGVQGDNQGRGAALGSDFTVTGGIGGADYVFSQRFIAGVAAQWTNTDVDFKKRVDTADVQSFEIGGYFSYGDADFCLNGNASIIFHDFDTYRFPFGGTAHGSYDGMTVSAYLEAGKVFEFDVLRVEPIVALTFTGLDTDAYAEDGTALATLLNVEGASHRSLKSIVGTRVAYPLDLLESGRKIVPEARILWAHEYLDDQAQFRAALQVLPGNPFNVRGQRFSRDSLLGGIGLNVPVSSRAVLYVDYDLALSRDRSIQSLSVGARFSW